eukprot:gene19279-21205_t
MTDMKQVTHKAPVNIAVVKYWGKRDETINLPLNGSISITLGLNELCAKTTAAYSTKFTRDRLWLNGREEEIEDNSRVQNCLKEIRRLASKRHLDQDSDFVKDKKVHICSENNFPTAAGLASSAAGYACLVSTLSSLFGISSDVSYIARQGSGSACRSMYGGFVKWNKGEHDSGLDSISVQIAPENHWPELCVLILVVNDHRKAISSTIGMQQSASTSEFLKFRVSDIVPRRLEEMQKAIASKDFPSFAELTMKESNQLHSICLDTFPPITYLNQTSHRIIEFISTINDSLNVMKAAYSFDAGPNAFIFTTDDFVDTLTCLMGKYFGFGHVISHDESFIRGIPLHMASNDSIDDEILKGFERKNFLPSTGELKYIISTKCGGGPKELGIGESLLDNFGQPKAKVSKDRD